MGSPSSIGFGYQPYGSEQFGSADWAEEVTWKIIPEFYRELDAKQTSLVAQPLRKFIDSIKPLFQDVRVKFELFPNLWDAQRCPFPQLPALAYNVGIPLTSVQTLGLADIVGPPFELGEQIVGSGGGVGFLSSVSGITFSLSGVSSLGFKVGETITGASSGQTAVLETVNGLPPSQTVSIRTFVVGETIQGSNTATKGVVGSVSSNSINVDAVTGVGFTNGEALTGLTSKVSGIVNGISSDGKSEAFLRSQVLNASQLWINKGTTKGYGIVAAFEGLFVIVTPLWADSCAPDPNGELLTSDPPPEGSYLAYFDAVEADIIAMDALFQTPADAWPYEVDSVVVTPGLPDSRCRSYTLDLYFFSPNDNEIEDFDALAGRITTSLERFRPIHVKFSRVRFDGPSASSQPWRTGPVVAESYASGQWVSPITGTLDSVSQTWSITSLQASN